ncbi:hypothetical protein HYDPIDRAFT_108548 [Hydnomerulius pinastri MD-312]|nr:hypothetical protein HYDPIDRAFT_108548 [Hydnomerulius pinastri MD-312]
MHVESTFSPDIIAALVSLQTRNYIYASVAAFWTYDYCLKWDEDYEFVFRTPWRSSKLLYLIARYSPFCLLAAHLYLNLLPNESVMTCTLLDNISSLFTALSMMSAECIFMLRAWALWGRSRRILCLIVGSFLLILALDMFVSFGVAKPSQIAPVPPEAQGSLTGCYTVHHDKAQMIPFAMIVVFELEVLALTFIRAVESYSQRRSELLKILLQHNVFYFSCGLVFSGVNIFAIMVFEVSSCLSVSYLS